MYNIILFAFLEATKYNNFWLVIFNPRLPKVFTIFFNSHGRDGYHFSLPFRYKTPCRYEFDY